MHRFLKSVWSRFTCVIPAASATTSVGRKGKRRPTAGKAAGSGNRTRTARLQASDGVPLARGRSPMPTGPQANKTVLHAYIGSGKLAKRPRRCWGDAGEPDNGSSLLLVALARRHTGGPEGRCPAPSCSPAPSRSPASSRSSAPSRSSALVAAPPLLTAPPLAAAGNCLGPKPRFSP